MPTPELSRRAFGCAALFGITGPLLVACSSSAQDPAKGATASTGAATPGTPLIAASDVPVGGGVIIADQQIVVTQPTEGEFQGFSSICTHQGNPVGVVSNGRITCNFHGSQFSVADGAVVTGPATAPLPEIAVKVEGGKVLRA